MDRAAQDGVERAMTGTAPQTKMEVGFNYPIPWNAAGLYFGGGDPPGSSPEMDVWQPLVRANLQRLRDVVGVRVVRFWLLCNATNYGSVADGEYTRPTEVSRKFFDHAEQLLQIFADLHMRAIPSVIDFKAFGPAGRLGCTGRFPIANDASARRQFLSEFLAPLVESSSAYRNAIYAWEIMNEPVWNTTTLSPATHWSKTVSAAAMRIFLREALDTIAQVLGKDFPTTVGHRFWWDLESYPTGSVRQFHYYPKRGLRGYLPMNERDLPPWQKTRAFIGEFGELGQNAAGDWEHGQPWPSLRGADADDTYSRVLERLRRMNGLGYPLALLWPPRDYGYDAANDPIKMSDEARRAIIDYHRSV